MEFFIFQIFSILLAFIYLQKTLVHQDITIPSHKESIGTILKTSKETVGKYNNNPIYRYILIDTNEIFEYLELFNGNVDENFKFIIINNLKYKFHSNKSDTTIIFE